VDNEPRQITNASDTIAGIIQDQGYSNNCTCFLRSVFKNFVFWFQGAMEATYRAVSQSPPTPNLGPVVLSQLAQRRHKSRTK